MRTIEMTNGVVKMIDQRKLPCQFEIVECRDYRAVAHAIKDMTIRGAPAIGAAAAFGLALAARESRATTREELLRDLDAAAQVLRATRPTAVNLGWALDRMIRKARAANLDANGLRDAVEAEAQRIAEEDVETNRQMAQNGAALIDDGDTVLTHCNAGALATAGYGTALGVIRAAVESGKHLSVIADETRPFLQGSRLTAWELMKDGIPTTLISDNMAGHMMAQGKIQAVIVGADRIAANGDTANKIGTYSVAILAKEHNIPFYVAAPFSTVDLETPDGSRIPIEERNTTEVTHLAGKQIAPTGVAVRNPAFDVTPAKYIAAIITERGVAKAPYTESLQALAEATTAKV